MVKTRDKNILKHVINYCDYIEDGIAQYGNSIEIFKSNIHYRSAMAMYAFQIIELTVHLTDDCKIQRSEDVPCSKMRDMRTFFAHRYGKLDTETLWKTIVKDIPAMKQFSLDVLSQDDKPEFFQIKLTPRGLTTHHPLHPTRGGLSPKRN
ncbi:MAG: DUF86 domain-containing protein [Deltaproteobacteria bacterium]|jgi:uncharacterized protein with HEPN domain|nr:DUF86 domain-containing protein [Deltaproteobacteria bacterium]